MEDLLGLGAALPAAALVDGLVGGPWVVQPVVESIRTEGELSIFVLDGIPVTQAVKLPGPGEIRVHEEYGGVHRRLPSWGPRPRCSRWRRSTPPRTCSGPSCPTPGSTRCGSTTGRLVVSELEVTEPGLYLDVLPRNAVKFARMVQEVRARRHG